MQFCPKHWEDLKTEIIMVGLGRFIFKNGEQAAKHIEEQLKGLVDPKDPYDPLMSAHWAIMGNALRCGGLYMMSGDFCPLCELEAHSPAKAEEWITPCCQEILQDFKKNGWYTEPLVN